MKLQRSYATVNGDLGTHGLEETEQVPESVGECVHEEVVETFLALHLPALIGMPAVPIFRAPPLWTAEDVLAIDVLGRVHVFEIKTERIKRQHLLQLQQYLLSYVFADVDQFCRDRLSQHERTSGPGMAALLAGAFRGTGVRKMGADEIRRLLGARADSVLSEVLGGSASWETLKSRASVEQRTILRGLATLAAVAAENNSSVPTWDDLVSLGKTWDSHLTRHAPSANYPIRFSRPVVLWLVGPELATGGEDPLSALSSLRRAGIDARYLGLEVRRLPATRQWQLRIEREVFQQRAAVERKLVDIAMDLTSRGVQGTGRTRFYREAAPSKQDADDTLGQPLFDEASAVVSAGRAYDVRP